MEPLISVRIVNADYYYSAPIPGLDVAYSMFRGSEVKRVPVVRIFGSTLYGQKTCLHLHGIYPYLYIPYDGSMPSDKLRYLLARELDKALNVILGTVSTNSQHVYDIILVSGYPLYGYHKSEHQYFKVYFYNPLILKKAGELLLNGAVLNKVFQPHESHIPYVLQFMMDYNLQGMNFIHLRSVRFRANFASPAGLFVEEDSFQHTTSQPKLWTAANIPASMVLPSFIEAKSSCQLEIDAIAGDILNRYEIQEGVLMNPGLASIWDDEIQRRKQMGLEEPLTAPSSQDRFGLKSTASELFYLQRLKARLLDIKPVDLSLTVTDVNSQLSSTLAVETPEDEPVLPASYVLMATETDSLDTSARKRLDLSPKIKSQISTHSVNEEDQELLDILEALAADQEGETTLKETSLNVTQASQTNRNVLRNSDSEESDGERQTLEMTQTHWATEEENAEPDQNEQPEQLLCSISAAPSPEASEPLFHPSSDSEEVSIGGCSSSTEFQLPNLDGAYDTSSSDEENRKQAEALRKSPKKLTKLRRTSPAKKNYTPLEVTFRPARKRSRLKPSQGTSTKPNNKTSFNPDDTKNAHSHEVPLKIPSSDEDMFPGIRTPDPPVTDSIPPLTRGESPNQCESYALMSKPKTEANQTSSEFNKNSHYTTRVCEENKTNPPSAMKRATLRVGLRPLVEEMDRYELQTGVKLSYALGSLHTSSSTKFTRRLSVNISPLGQEVSRYHRSLSVPINEKSSTTADTTKLLLKPGSKGTLKSEEIKNSISKTCEIQSASALQDVTVLRDSDASRDPSPVCDPRLVRDPSPVCDPSPVIATITASEPELLNVPCAVYNPVLDQRIGDISSAIGHSTHNSSPVLAAISSPDRSPVPSILKAQNSALENSYEAQQSNPDPKLSQYCTEVKNPRMNAGPSCVTGPTWLQYAVEPPSIDRVLATLETYGLPSVLPVQVFWGDPNDEPKIATNRSAITSVKVESLEPFQATFPDETLESVKKRNMRNWDQLSTSLAQDMAQFVVQPPVRPVVMTPLLPPPSFEHIRASLLPKANKPEHKPAIKTPARNEKFVEDVKPMSIERPMNQSTPVPGVSQTRRRSILSVTSKDSPQDRSPLLSQRGVKKRRRISWDTASMVSSESSSEVKSAKEEGPGRCSSSSPLITPSVLRTPQQRRQVLLLGSSQLEGPSLNNTLGFKVTLQNFQDAKALHEHQHLTVMDMELHVSTREELRPDPEFDSIEAVFYTIINDVEMNATTPRQYSGVIMVDVEGMVTRKDLLRRSGMENLNVKCVESESTLLRAVIELVKVWDPDILLGYEIEMHSWGYLLQRGTQLGMNLRTELGRLPETARLERDQQEELYAAGATDRKSDAMGYFAEKNSDLALVGRIVLNLWRLLRPEVALTSYTFENMAYHILHQRIPLYSYQTLTEWWASSTHHHRWRVVEHYMARVLGSIKIVEQLDLIGRTSELARLFGIQFYEVLTRGSQWRVESMMLRLAKPLNFIPVSPSIQQRAKMKAPEYLPLIMEPESKFYTDPVLVLDFQSLYPSIIIAYNYCFSTCLGRTSQLGKTTPFEFGCSELFVPPEVVAALQNQVNISPAGAVFVKSAVRRGILPRMLEEILDTRLMVKRSMKMYKDNKLLQRVLDARQLGLKLIANVTYGYTSANFSGRMPCVEVGDSVVSKGRETLERAIKLVESNPQWGARVIYGDTDSMFVLVPGKSRAEAFTVGTEIADAVTKTNPKPVKLKFEKVYQPCILQTKKRYVGYSYETPDQKEPKYDAKGIETVRRDGCPAVVKILEKSLRVLFETYNMSSVKSYVQRQFTKILQGRVSLQDFTFAKEYRGPQGYRPGACVPALEISKKLLQSDRRADFRVGQRVPYVIVYGSPGLPLIQLVKEPAEVLNDPSLRLNAHYYITRAIIPPLQRCLGLLGVDVDSWYSALPRMVKPASNWNPVEISSERNAGSKKRGFTISQYFVTLNCLLCDQQPRGTRHEGLCDQCSKNLPQAAALLAYKARLWEKTYVDMIQVCGYCAGRAAPQGLACISLDCPILYKRCLSQRDADKAPVLWHQLDKLYG